MSMTTAVVILFVLAALFGIACALFQD